MDYVELAETEGDYYYQGRWFDSEVGDDAIQCKGTITAGSELYFKVSNTSNLWLRTHSTSNQNPVVAVSVNGAAPVRVTTAASGDVLIASGLEKTKAHTVRVIVDGLYEYMTDKWIYGYGFNFEKAVVDEGGEITGIKPQNKVICYFGDSITEGVCALKQSVGTDGNSHTNAYPFHTSHLLGCVSYTNGYGASGIMKSGSGSVPKCLTVIDYILDGEAFDIPEPDVVVINHGHNDSGTDSDGNTITSSTFIAGYEEVLARLRTKFPDAKIVAVVPFNQSHSSDIKTAVENFNDSETYYLSTSGWIYTKTDGAHPDEAGAEALGQQLSTALIQTLDEDFFN